MIDYLKRSLMFVPAHNNKLMDSAVRSSADVLLLDIEDSVQPVENKQKARDNIIEYVTTKKFNNRILFPRVNDRESGELLKDVYQLTIPGITGFLYPKAKTGEDIYFFGKLLETIEYEKGFPIGTFKMMALVETTGAIVNLKEICQASPERLVAITFGCEDYMTDLQGVHCCDYRNIEVARALIAVTARAFDIAPIDTVHIRVHDLEDLEKQLKFSRELGFEGMLVLNPKELPLVHQYYSPSQKQIDWATEMITLSEQAIAEGKGVAVKDNKFIGPPMVKMAKQILAKKKMIDEV
ncbi:MAG: CoA ester lyase [Porphyromonas sp.]|nr:CoA ester lyase [Porphyromonas sp.]